KNLADAILHVHLEEIKVDKTLRFVEEPVKIIDREWLGLRGKHCMSTRSSTRNLFPPLKDLERTIRRITRVNPNLLNDFEEINMAANENGDDGPPPAGGGDLPVPDLRTMEELCNRL
ncbi:hypothetical protein Tco_1234601, partial [Tanacetum coccineum]